MYVAVRSARCSARQDQRDWAYVSASTIRVRLAFSIVNLTFPPSPAIRPGGDQRLLRYKFGRGLADCSRKMVSMQGLDIFDLEGVEVEVV